MAEFLYFFFFFIFRLIIQCYIMFKNSFTHFLMKFVPQANWIEFGRRTQIHTKKNRSVQADARRNTFQISKSNTKSKKNIYIYISNVSFSGFYTFFLLFILYSHVSWAEVCYLCFTGISLNKFLCFFVTFFYHLHSNCARFKCGAHNSNIVYILFF